ncbi:ParA family protein [Actinomadura sp. 3N407]|uniref:ParA family protein n=1 Tax=Actinomadura sp. 3N407 TaxID=3457423 RepID=UPI003FCE9A3E
MPPTTKVKLPYKPWVITLGNLKGGAGKSTSAFFLAVYLAEICGLRVLLIDADPLSQTAYSWHRVLRKDLGVPVPFKLAAFASPRISDYITDQSETGEFDVIIVDTGGENESILKAALSRSHELIIITSPNDAETERVPGTFEAAQDAAATVEHEIRVRVLLVKVPPIPSLEGKDARDDLADGGYDVFTAQATNWKWYRKAARTTNPLDDLAEFEDIGAELVADYTVKEAA